MAGHIGQLQEIHGIGLVDLVNPDSHDLHALRLCDMGIPMMKPMEQ